MDAVQRPLTYRDDPGLYKRFPTDKYPPKTEPDEPHYVDLVDVRPEGTRNVHVTSSGEGVAHKVIDLERSALAPIDRPISAPREHTVSPEGFPEELPHDKWFDMTVTDEGVLHAAGSGPDPSVDLGENTLLQKDHDPRCCADSLCSASDDMEYTDLYLNSRTHSDTEEKSEVRSDHGASDQVEDESHYITTHEIQLTELDHDVDYDLGRGGDCEDDNLVYTFVDYALFESDEKLGEQKKRTLLNITHGYAGRAAGAPPESDSDNSSDEGVFKNPCANTHAQERLIHLSIKPTARAEDSSDTFSANGRVKPAQYRGRFLAPGNPRGCDFIPAPGRQHLATKLRWKDVNSSGASSSISELDDADKEVRNLTAKTFRSLACPYFDAINLSTSSESSMSEYGLGLNQWSAYVNLNHGNMAQQTLAHKSSRATFAVSKAAEIKREESNAKAAAQSKMHAMNKHETHPKRAHNTLQTQQPQWGDVITLTETINFRVEAELPDSRRQLRCSHSAHGGSRTKQGVATGDTQTRATFASSHLKNVISKKMQFEQEQQLVRGDYFARSPCSQCREQEPRGSPRRPSGSGSELTVNSLEGIVFEGPTLHACETQQDTSDTAPLDKTLLPEPGKPDPVEPQKARLNHSQSSAFTPLRGEPGPQAEPQASAHAAEQNPMAVVNRSSHLFVPSSVFLSKEREPWGQAQGPGAPAPAARVPGACAAQPPSPKPPEIKIRLRPAKENRGQVLNIAKLLTPQLSRAGSALRTPGCSRLPVPAAPDRAPDRAPHFTVRDVRDNKCKFQAPIYHVRDVRKLVKSSYGCASAENADSPAAAPEPGEGRRGPAKHVGPSPIFIRCNSVKTDRDGGPHSAAAAAQTPPPKPQEVRRGSPGGEGSSSHRSAGRGPPPATAKPPPPPPPPPAGEPKVPNQAALEKLQAAVRTMEQLYVFDRNEWRRRGGAPRPASRQEPGAEAVAAATGGRPEAHRGPAQAPGSGARPRPSRTVCKKSVLRLEPGPPRSQDPPPSAPSRAAGPPQRPFGGPGVAPSGADPGNYLTIPRPGRSGELRPPPLSAQGGPPSAVIYHRPAPSPPAPAPPQPRQAQRKMLLDVATGFYYLVDTPPRRPPDPASGGLVDVPVPCPPATPLALSPLTLGPGACAAAYLLYPGPAPPTPLPPAGAAPEGPYYSATGGAAHARAAAAQGPRIVAPPRFDGTTMSLVVEHR